MPELPEVETVCQGMRSEIIGCRFRKVQLNRPDLRWKLPLDMGERLNGSVVNKVIRRGKYILIESNNSKTLIIHLGMSGRLIIKKGKHKKIESGAFYHNTNRKKNVLSSMFKKHDHVLFYLARENEELVTLVYNDARRFGAIDLVDTPFASSHKWLKSLGPEPFGEDFSVTYLKMKFKKKVSSIKAALLDQTTVAGIGNIYVSEILWKVRVSPFRKAGELNEIELEKIIQETQSVLNTAILKGGSSLKDFKNTNGDMGYFQTQFNVYDRDGLNCKSDKCSGIIKRVFQNGRSSYFCNCCQD